MPLHRRASWGLRGAATRRLTESRSKRSVVVALHDEGEPLLQAEVSASMLFREFEDSSAAANYASQRIAGDDHR
jgi:hypothetical protein